MEHITPVQIPIDNVVSVSAGRSHYTGRTSPGLSIALLQFCFTKNTQAEKSQSVKPLTILKTSMWRKHKYIKPAEVISNVCGLIITEISLTLFAFSAKNISICTTSRRKGRFC
jgi:hypothetical protein